MRPSNGAAIPEENQRLKVRNAVDLLEDELVRIVFRRSLLSHRRLLCNGRPTEGLRGKDEPGFSDTGNPDARSCGVRFRNFPTVQRGWCVQAVDNSAARGIEQKAPIALPAGVYRAERKRKMTRTCDVRLRSKIRAMCEGTISRMQILGRTAMRDWGAPTGLIDF